MLLYDRIRAAFADPPLPDDIPIITANSIQQRIDLLPDNSPQPTAADYGAVAPPFPAFFIEARTQSTNPNEQAEWVERGVLFFTWDITEHNGYPPRYAHITHYPGARWCFIAWGYLYYQGMLFHTPSCCVAQVANDGSLLDDTNRMFIVLDQPRTRLPATPPETLATMLPFALTSISALHRQCEVQHVTPTRQQRRQANRAGQLQPSASYTLIVRPGAVRTVADIARPAPRSAGQREHQVRAHFKYYHPDRPRFGRPGDQGMFWVDTFTRGESTIGAIRKNYKIEDFR